jgi:hypothetical protein
MCHLTPSPPLFYHALLMCIVVNWFVILMRCADSLSGT